mmetsp:Transcript_22779/g.46870  ORF Transcript_22779/g.46870 Transcript_22779/m.46870 type:complete len:319 (+) Transcript_22779:418-1374(+)
MMHMVDDVHVAMANVLGHPCDNRLRQPIPLPCPRTAPLLVRAAPALLRLGPAVMPVLDSSNAVVVALLNHMLNFCDWNFLVDGLGRHGNWHVDDLPWYMHRDCNRLVVVRRRRRNGLGHIVLLRDVVLHDARWASSLNLDDGAGIMDGNMDDVIDFARWRRWHHDFLWHGHVMNVRDGLVVVPVLNLRRAGLLELVAAVTLMLMGPLCLPAAIAFRALERMMLDVHLLRDDLGGGTRNWHGHHVGDVLRPHVGVILVVDDHGRFRRRGAEAYIALRAAGLPLHDRHGVHGAHHAGVHFVSPRLIEVEGPEEVEQKPKK